MELVFFLNNRQKMYVKDSIQQYTIVQSHLQSGRFSPWWLELETQINAGIYFTKKENTSSQYNIVMIYFVELWIIQLNDTTCSPIVTEMLTKFELYVQCNGAVNKTNDG